MIQASRAAYTVCGVLTALAVAGWGFRAAGQQHANTTANRAPVSVAPQQGAPDANTGGTDQTAGGTNGATDQNTGGDPAANPGADPNAAPNNAGGGDPYGGNNAGAANNAPAATGGDATTSLTATEIPKMGSVVTDSNGFVLYRFDKDTPNPPTSNCNGACAQTWPPVTTTNGQLPQLNGIDPALVGTIQRSDGLTQVTIAGWPAYRYSKDPKPGAWKGQGVGGTWWVLAPDGKRNLTCLPPGVKRPSS